MKMPSKEEYLTHLNYGVKTCPAIYDVFKELIDKYFTLKERHSKILDDVHDYRFETHCMKMTIRNLCEHFGVKSEKELQNIYLNKPYKFEDLKPNMWVWDNRLKTCFLIHEINKNYEWPIIVYRNHLDNEMDGLKYEENRFYPVEYANEVINNVR